MTVNIHNIPDDFIVTKDNVYSLFCSEYTGKLASPLLRWSVIEHHPSLSKFLTEYYDDADASNSTASEILYRIMHDVDVRPVCPLCGQHVRFKRYRDGYKTFCDDCGKRPDIRKEVAKIMVNNNTRKYGATSPMKLDEYKQKVQDTCMERYGTKTVSQVSEFKEKQKQTYKEKYKDNIEAQQQVIEKRRQSYIERYGVEHPMQLPDIREKQIIHKKCNGTISSSKVEQQFKEWLQQNNIKFIEQYSCPEYPYKCDFYLPDKKLFIEIQGNWTHGPHPFNPDNPDDIALLNKWKSKATPYYMRAIKNWTVSDVEKRNTAACNKLNFLEIFSMDVNDVIASVKNFI